MIGSATMIVKKDGKYTAHRIPNVWMDDLRRYLSLMGKTFFQFWEDEASWWYSHLKKKSTLDYAFDSFKRKRILKEEVRRILRATTSIENSPGYHEFCGDGMYLLDLDKKQFFESDYGNNGNRIKAEWQLTTQLFQNT